MGVQLWISVLGIAGTLLLVVVGLLNFSVFRAQLRVAEEQIETAMRQLEIARKQPDLHLIQRAITETSDHLRLLVERPHLRPYFYDGVAWQPGDPVTANEVMAMAELMLNNFASALMHAAAFPEYPARGIDRIIMYHLRHSPALRDMLLETFDRFPFSGLSLLSLMNTTPEGVESDLQLLIDLPGLDEPERERRRQLLQVYRESTDRDALEFAALSMARRR